MSMITPWLIHLFGCGVVITNKREHGNSLNNGKYPWDFVRGFVAILATDWKYCWKALQSLATSATGGGTLTKGTYHYWQQPRS